MTRDEARTAATFFKRLFANPLLVRSDRRS